MIDTERETGILDMEEKEALTSLGEDEPLTVENPEMVLFFEGDIPREYLGLIHDHILAFVEELGIEVRIDIDVGS